MKLKDLFPGFMESCVARRFHENTVRQHRDLYLRFILPTVGDMEVADILPSHSDLVLMKAAKVSEGTSRRAIITLRRILRHGRRSGVMLRFDIEDIEVPVYRKVKDTQALSLEEVSMIRYALSTEKSYSPHAGRRVRERCRRSQRRMAALVELLLHSGLRLSEALGLNRDDLNFSNSEIRFVNVKTKEWESVYFFGAEEFMRSYLEEREDDSEALFVSESGKRMGYDTAQTYLKLIKRRIGLKKNLNHHLLRSTFVTMLLRAGLDPRVVQKLARHKSLQTTLIYYYAVEQERLAPAQESVMSLI